MKSNSRAQRRVSTWLAAVASTAMLCVGLAACGGSKVSAANDVPLPAMPMKIVSLSPTATETLFAIGAGKRVAAVDSMSTYPLTAPTTSLSAFNLNIEAVAKYKPDLVVLSFDTTTAKNALAGFKQLKIPVLLQPAAKDLNEVYSQIKELGVVTGLTQNAESLVTDMQQQIAAAIKSANPGKGLKVFHEVDSTLYTATSDTFIGHVYKDFGLTNIADAAASADAKGYPQLTSEYVVKANPDLIFLADSSYGTTIESVMKRPGWGATPGGKIRTIVPLNSDIASRWGPRVVELYKTIGRSIPAQM